MSLSDDNIIKQWYAHNPGALSTPGIVGFARAVERAARAQTWREAAEVCEASATTLRVLSAQCDGDDGNLAAQANALDEMTDAFNARAEKEKTK